jgi:hypothetical protein
MRNGTVTGVGGTVTRTTVHALSVEECDVPTMTRPSPTMPKTASSSASHAYRKDAEAAGKYTINYLFPKHRAYQNCSVDVIYRLSRWAGHWGVVALQREDL